MRHADGTERAECPSFQRYAVGKRRSCTDTELIAQVLAGDKFAFDALLLRHSPVVLGYLSSRVAERADAEDLAQEVFLSAYSNLSTLRDPERFGAWLVRIAQNRLSSFLRTAARRRQTRVDLDAAAGGPADMVSDPSPTPAERAAASQTRLVLLEEIARLREKYREVVSARLVREETTEEVARRMGLTPEAVRVRLLRGMEKLRKALQRRGVHFGDASSSDGRVRP